VPTLDVNGETVHYVETGGGAPTLVLVHGSGGRHDVWTPQLQGLAEIANVVALDLPGHGRSSGEGCRRIVDYAAVVRGFAASLGRGPVVLGGHSMGGAIAQTVALTAPEVLRGVVLVGTGARLRVFPRLLELLAKDYAEAVAFVSGYAWSPSSPESLKEAGRRALSATRGSVTSGDFAACDVFDVMSALGQIQRPTLVIVGEDDRLTPPKYAEYLAGHIARARLVRVARAGHYVQLEQPDQVNEAIRSFLATV
jgi:pimeloyl-ACP methyl ester carboxylesterase